jgi:NACalpha-BTF3-like transcription factor
MAATSRQLRVSSIGHHMVPPESGKRTPPYRFALINPDCPEFLLSSHSVMQEHLSALPDASARISRTEEVLGKQVNPNFLKLAIFNAEQGRAVPPLAAPFVRLLLLKGVIRLLHERDARAAIETLTEAGALCKALEVDPEHTEQLLQLGTSEEGAIAALRKAGGDVQRAAVDILDQVEKGRVAAEDRKKQRMFGPTADKASYVNLERIAVVRDVLSVDYDVAVSLLRLSNNSIDVAADLWHQAGRDRSDILERAYNIAPRSTKKLRPQQTAQPPVDEIALVTLMSTGIDKELAEAALRGTANEGADPVEAAMAWLNGDGVLAAGFADTNPAPEVEGERIDSQMRDDHDPVGKLPDQMSESSRGDSDSVDEEFASAEEQEALELLQHELAGVLRKSNLAEEHLGVTLQEERVLIDRYLSLAHSQVSA